MNFRVIIYIYQTGAILAPQKGVRVENYRIQNGCHNCLFRWETDNDFDEICCNIEEKDLSSNEEIFIIEHLVYHAGICDLYEKE